MEQIAKTDPETDRAGEAGAAEFELFPTSAPVASSSQVERASSDAPAPAAIAQGPYPASAANPTQGGPEGILFDFNEGCRLLLPIRETGLWRARLRDLDTGNTLFETENKGGLIRSAKRWFVRFCIEVWSLDEGAGEQRLVIQHDYDAADRDILIQFPVGTVGDSVAWFAYACRFGEGHPGARVTIAMSPLMIALFRDAYPEINFVTPDEVTAQKLNENAYATYCLGLFFQDVACEWQPVDFRHVGLHKTAGHILGVDLTEKAPRIKLPDESRPIVEPYVVIAVQATSAAKMWTNPNGWREIIAFLKARGYRVICVDQKPVHGQGLFWNHIPNGCEDMTGLSLAEAARYMRHAALFVGLSSGLSWLAWAAGCPTVLISGFSLPSTEFETPGRVINWHTCNGCWNDPNQTFDHKDFLWCPRHSGTPRQFECTRLITPGHVTRVIETFTRFGAPPTAN